MALDSSTRLREEDPYTASWTSVGDTSVVCQRSRFEVDFNRPRSRAVYLCPEDAWGLQVWRERPDPALVRRSLRLYDRFYEMMRAILMDKESRHGGFVVLDLHSYNHRRVGPWAPDGDPESNPDVNIGTGSMDRERWAPVVDRFMGDLRRFDFQGRHLDVRENVKFTGANLAAWAHRTFDRGCVLAIECKKFFMEEWSGRLDHDVHATIRAALASCIPGLRASLEEVLRARPRRLATAQSLP